MTSFLKHAKLSGVIPATKAVNPIAAHERAFAMDIDISVDKHELRLKGIRSGQKQFFPRQQPEPFLQVEFRDSSRSAENAIIVDDIEAV